MGKVKNRQTVSHAAYTEVLNLVRNTLNFDENTLLINAGYSSHVATKWRQEGQVPLIAVNALRGLLLGHELACMKKENQPLLLSTDDLILLAGEARSAKLRAALYREIARRVDPDGK